MSIDACAALVQKGDPDRFVSLMTAPAEGRAPLLVLYAFNLEIARAPWLARESMIAEMRLQFWDDVIAGALEGRAAPPHEVAAPLADLVARGALPADLLRDMIEARRRHALDPALDEGERLTWFLDETSGHLMWLAAHLLGAPPEAQPVVRDQAYASGFAALLLAVPALNRAGKAPFAATSERALGQVAASALARLKQARAARTYVPKRAHAALRAGFFAAPVLRRAIGDPARIAAGTLGQSDFRKRLRLIRLELTSRW